MPSFKESQHGGILDNPHLKIVLNVMKFIELLTLNIVSEAENLALWRLPTNLKQVPSVKNIA